MNWVGFPGLGIDKIEIMPYFSIFGFKVYWYGALIALGMVLAMVYGMKNSKKFGVDSDKMIDVVIVGIISGIVGARIYYVVFEWDTFKDNLGSIFDLRMGGLAIYGGIIFSVIFGGLACKWRKVNFLSMLDIAGIGFLLGQGIGRWGNFVNVEAFGSHTDLPWGMIGNKIPSSMGPVHPTFLYESLWCLLGFLLLVLYVKHRKFDGQIFLMYLAWYGFERMFVEGLRTDSLWLVPGVIRVSQLLSIILFIGATAVLLYILFYYMKKNPDKNYLYVKSDEWKNLMKEKAEKKEGKVTDGKNN